MDIITLWNLKHMMCINASLFPDPNVSLPMAEMVNGVLQGSVSGNAVGTVTITSRNMDSGIEFDGVTGYVDFGMHDGKCFHSPDACNAGVTFALWLWAGDNPRSVIVLDSGGFTAGKAGYCLKVSRSALHVVVKLVSNNGKHPVTTNWKDGIRTAGNI